jgi:predicted NBD/HSP70 family sugar kinase
MKYILGIDVGGTKIAAGLVDSSLKIHKVRIFATSKNNLTAQLAKVIKSFGNFSAIGIGVPGQVLPDGTVTKLPNLKKFKRTNLKQLLEKQFQVPVHVMNDAQAFTLAEARIGIGKNAKRMAGVIMGTGIGGGIVINGKIYSGDKYQHAGEWGWIKVRSKVTLEQAMHKFGKFTEAEHASPFAEVLIGYITQVLSPDTIVFGGGRVNFPGIEKVLQRALKVVAPSARVKVIKSKLQYPGAIGAVIPLLKK